MPEVAYTTVMRSPHDAVWQFVSDMNNWAPFLTGYQKHEIIDATDSLWTLKGEVGILSRKVELARARHGVGPARARHVHADGGERGRRGRGDGRPPQGDARPRGNLAAAAGGRTARRPLPPHPGLAGPPPLPAREPRRSRARRPPSAGRHDGDGVELELTLRMDAGGPAGPLVNAMLGPALEPAVEDLAKKIAAHMERGSGSSDSGFVDARHERSPA